MKMQGVKKKNEVTQYTLYKNNIKNSIFFFLIELY